MTFSGRPLPKVSTPANFQSLKTFSSKGCIAAKDFGIGNPGEHQTVPLVGYAETFFGGGVIGILHQSGLARHQCVLPVIDRFGEV